MKKIIMAVMMLVSLNTFADTYFEQSIDEFNDTTTSIAWVTSTDESAYFMVRCRNDKFEVYFNAGRFTTMDDNYPITIRVDKMIAKTYKFSRSTDFDAAFFRNRLEYDVDGTIQDLLPQLKTGSKAIVKYYDWPGRAKTVKFLLRGTNKQFSKVEKACGIGPEYYGDVEEYYRETDSEMLHRKNCLSTTNFAACMKEYDPSAWE